MAPPLSTAIPDERVMRESSKESSGVPLESNLCTKPEPVSAKNALPVESVANATGILSFPASVPLSPQALINSNGGGRGGLGAGSVFFAQDTPHAAMSSATTRHPGRPRDSIDRAAHENSGSGIVRFLRPNNTMSVRSVFGRGMSGSEKPTVALGLRKSGIGTLL